jgi:exoribonuclease R
MKPKIATKWEIIDLIFIRKKFPDMTWQELLSAVNEIRPASQQVSLNALRHQARRMGLKKGIQIRCSSRDVEFLLSNYRKMGNTEIAGKLNKAHRSCRVIEGKAVFRTFTKKHVEKKMKLPGLHRTKEQPKETQFQDVHVRTKFLVFGCKEGSAERACPYICG